MLKSLIFDFDGLIIDTETPWYTIFCDIYKQYGIHLPLEMWAQSIGTDGKYFDPFIHLEQQIQKPIDKDFINKYAYEKHAVVMKDSKLNPGVKKYLQTGKSIGLKIGLASSSDRKWVEQHLKQFDLLDYFDYICTKEDVAHVKPDPELYLKVLKFFGISGKKAVAFEDSPKGAQAAKDAGIYCVIVPNELTKMLQFEKYDERVNSLDEYSLELLLKRIESRI